MLWLSARSTTAAPCWPVSPVIYWTGCSPSSTLPPDSCSQPGAPNASPRFSATFVGCGSRNMERIQFRLCVLAYCCLNGSAPLYLTESIRRTADVEGRRHLRSSTTMTLVVPTVQRLTLGDRAFPVAASWAWISLPRYHCHPNCFILHLISATTEDTSV